MLFSRKYIFETKETRLKRFFANLCVLCLIGLFLYTVLCAHLVYFAMVQNEITSKAISKNPPELVVVFTGDVGRISEGLSQAKKNPDSKIFITGVYNTSSIKDILDKIPGHDYNEEISKKIDIDYQAKNTVENVISTLYYLRKSKTFKRVLIISSDYHLSRINLILGRLTRVNDNYEFYLLGMKSKLTQLRSLKILYREGVKWMKTIALLFLWDTEGQMIYSFNEAEDMPND